MQEHNTRTKKIMKVQYGDLSDLFQATFESRSCIRMGGSLKIKIIERQLSRYWR